MNAQLTLLAQQNGGGDGLGAAMAMLISLAIVVLIIAGFWKMFVKAGQPGWGVLIPIYNVYLMIKIAGRPGWWLLLLIVPIVNVIIPIVLIIDIANRFGKGIGFVLGMIFFSYIFFPILGFGSAQYQPAPAYPPQA